MRNEIAILDKSAFEALSREEHFSLFEMFMQNITPILGIEVLADLLKAHDVGKAPEAWVQTLAAKFGGSGDPVNMDFKELVAGELAGNPVPMKGRIIPDKSSLVRHAGGETAMIVDLGPFNHGFLRWADGTFTSGDRLMARWWRERGPNIGQEALWAELQAREIPLARPRGKVTEIVDGLLDRDDLQSVWLDYMLTRIEATERFRPIIHDRWLRGTQKKLKAFAPYSHHCLRGLLAVLILTKHQLVSQKPSNFIDAQYLDYLPFCQVFVSGDKLHQLVVPELLGPGQRFLSASDLKNEIGTLLKGT